MGMPASSAVAQRASKPRWLGLWFAGHMEGTTRPLQPSSTPRSQWVRLRQRLRAAHSPSLAVFGQPSRSPSSFGCGPSQPLARASGSFHQPEVAERSGSKNKLASYAQEIKGLGSILITIRTEGEVIFTLQ